MSDHTILIATQRQIAVLVAERDALRAQLAAVVAERDALSAAMNARISFLTRAITTTRTTPTPEPRPWCRASARRWPMRLRPVRGVAQRYTPIGSSGIVAAGGDHAPA